MNGNEVRITKLDAQGEPKMTYPGRRVFSDEQVCIVRCLWTAPEPFDLGPFALEAGDIFIEYYYREQWFNVFAIYDRLGALKGWYGNITAPPELGHGAIRWRDLALDLLVLPDGAQIVLDEEEFRALALPVEQRRAAEVALETLRRWAQEGQGPFQPLARRGVRS